MSAGADARPEKRVLVLFGATGDLACRMLFPGLLHLQRAGLMPEDFRVIGSGRHSPGSDDEFREQIREALGDAAEEAGDEWEEFAERLSFVASDADDGADLAAAVKSAEEEIGAEGERLLYLSVPAGAMEPMVAMLGASGLAESARLVIEKPFGHDAESARKLNAALHEVLAEEAIFRIDHFLGKEAAQNLLALRFANGLFEPIWNRDHIAYVQIDVPEELDVEGRGSFYEETGAFRDMVVNHLLQLLGLVAIEPPAALETEPLHAERTKLFAALRPLDPGRVVFGQYEGYREEDDVEDDSTVETFAALEARVDNWRWRGVPFYLRTGKALAATRRTVTIGLVGAPPGLVPEADDDGGDGRPSEIVFELSEDPTARIDVRAKLPGPVLETSPASFRLDVEREIDGGEGLEAYARLLHDVMLGDRTLFSRAEQLERLWEACQPVLDAPPRTHPYERGSWGPQEALDLPGEPGWRLPDDGT
jgi:glucose-6-phosphate 1-dehydrogenase